jgi:hypothetical protein
VFSDQQRLRELLSHPAHPEIKLLISGRIAIVTAMAALRLARSGEYHWWGSRHRVSKMRPIYTNRWQHCYRTTAAATLQPSVGWLWRTIHHSREDEECLA